MEKYIDIDKATAAVLQPPPPKKKELYVKR